MNRARRRRHGMGTRLLLGAVHGLLGALVAAGAWWIAYGTVGDAFLVSIINYQVPERLIIGGGFLLGCVGGVWLGRDRPKPHLWMLSGGVLAGAAGFGITIFSPEYEFGWPMIAFLAVAGFLAAAGACVAAARPFDAKLVDVSLAAHVSWAVPRFVLIAIAIVLGVVLWPARAVFIPSVYAVLGMLLASAAIAQEIRIRRLEQRVNELAR